MSNQTSRSFSVPSKNPTSSTENLRERSAGGWGSAGRGDKSAFVCSIPGGSFNWIHKTESLFHSLSPFKAEK